MSPRTSRLAMVGVLVLRRTVLDPVRDGRIRDLGWPVGLRSVVGTIALTYLAGLVLVLLARPLRAGADDLAVVTTYQLGLPRPLVGAVLVLVLVTTAAFLTAALHAPWWLRLLAVAATEGLLGLWGLSGGVGLFGRALQIVVGLVMLGILGLAVLTARRAFGWWQFATALGLLGLGFGAALLKLGLGAADFGYDLAPTLLDQTLQLLAVIAVPAALAAGVSVAEVTLRATLGLGAGVRRALGGRALYGVLAVVVLIRAAQLGWLARHTDPVTVGPAALLTSAAVVVALGLVALFVRPRPDDRESWSAGTLPERASRFGIPLGAALVILLAPVIAILVSLQILLAVDPTGPFAGLSPSPATVLTSVTVSGIFRLVLAGAAGVLALVVRRRGRPATALLLGSTAVMLVALTPRLLTGGRFATTVNPDLLNAFATLGVLVAVLASLIRRRLTPERGWSFALALLISALFSARDFVSDPLGTLIGVSGVGLVLFGVTWDLLTGSEWANGDSRRFPTPTRVLLVLANALLVVTILAFTALARDPNPGFALQPWAELGDFVLGTALVASGYATVLRGGDAEVVPGGGPHGPDGDQILGRHGARPRGQNSGGGAGLSERPAAMSAVPTGGDTHSAGG